MTAVIKHERQPKRTKTPKRAEEQQSMKVGVSGPDVPGHAPNPSLQHDINHVAGLGDIEESLDWIARGIGKLTSDEHTITLNLSTGYRTDPIRVTLEPNDYDDTLDPAW